MDKLSSRLSWNSYHIFLLKPEIVRQLLLGSTFLPLCQPLLQVP
jgi:hypothetical protein